MLGHCVMNLTLTKMRLWDGTGRCTRVYAACCCLAAVEIDHHMACVLRSVRVATTLIRPQPSLRLVLARGYAVKHGIVSFDSHSHA